jgi:transcriptional regulator with XRE-family HTH domain
MKITLPIETKLLESLLEKGEEIRKDQEILPLGSLVRMVRVGLGMTQRQLAMHAKVPHSTISRIEKGVIRPNEETLRKIFAAMECDIALIPVPRFKSVESLLRSKAKKIAEKRLQYLEGTMALEQQRPEKKWRERLLESEIEAILKFPSQLWEEDAN